MLDEWLEPGPVHCADELAGLGWLAGLAVPLHLVEGFVVHLLQSGLGCCLLHSCPGMGSFDDHLPGDLVVQHLLAVCLELG